MCSWGSKYSCVSNMYHEIVDPVGTTCCPYCSKVVTDFDSSSVCHRQATVPVLLKTGGDVKKFFPSW